MKGLGALIVEATEAGRAAGAEAWVRAQIAAELSEGEVALDRLLHGTVKHGARRGVRRDPRPTCSTRWGRPVMAGPPRRCTTSWPTPGSTSTTCRPSWATSRWPTSATRATVWAWSTPVSTHCGRAPGSSAGPARSGPAAATTRPSTGDLPRCRPGDVIVINGSGDTNRALIGELIAEKAPGPGVRRHDHRRCRPRRRRAGADGLRGVGPRGQPGRPVQGRAWAARHPGRRRRRRGQPGRPRSSPTTTASSSSRPPRCRPACSAAARCETDEAQRRAAILAGGVR